MIWLNIKEQHFEVVNNPLKLIIDKY